MANIKITETVLGGALSALIKSEMPLEDILPVLGLIDKAGYYSCEVLDRNTYYAGIAPLGEDPWERLRVVAKKMPNTRLQATFAGRYLLGERLFPDDIVEEFIKSAAKNGIKIFSMFDPLNDTDNLEMPIKLARQNNIHAQAGIIYTTSSIHTNGTFLSLAKKLENMGADSICLIDSSEKLTPYETYNIIAAIKQEIQLPMQFSTPNSTGIGYMNVLKAVEAGVDMVYCAVSPFADGVSFPSTETIVAAFQNTPYDSGLNLKSFFPVEEYFSKIKKRYIKEGILSNEKMLINPEANKTKLADDALAYLEEKIIDFPEITMVSAVEEMSKIRDLAGKPTLTFPIYIGIVDQAVLNLTGGEAFSTVASGFRNLLEGKYGKTPASIDPSFKESVLGRKDTYEAKALAPELEDFKKQLPEKFNEQPEDVLTLAMFPKTAPEYFENRSDRLYDIDGKFGDKLKQVHPI